MSPIRLPAEFTIYCVGELKPLVLDALASLVPGDPLALDASCVAEVDGAGVQWLIALRRAADARDCPLELHGATAVLREACAALGVPGLAGDVTGAAA